MKLAKYGSEYVHDDDAVAARRWELCALVLVNKHVLQHGGMYYSMVYSTLPGPLIREDLIALPGEEQRPSDDITRPKIRYCMW